MEYDVTHMFARVWLCMEMSHVRDPILCTHVSVTLDIRSRGEIDEWEWCNVFILYQNIRWRHKGSVGLFLIQSIIFRAFLQILLSLMVLLTKPKKSRAWHCIALTCHLTRAGNVACAVKLSHLPKRGKTTKSQQKSFVCETSRWVSVCLVLFGWCTVNILCGKMPGSYYFIHLFWWNLCPSMMSHV